MITMNLLTKRKEINTTIMDIKGDYLRDEKTTAIEKIILIIGRQYHHENVFILYKGRSVQRKHEESFVCVLYRFNLFQIS